MGVVVTLLEWLRSQGISPADATDADYERWRQEQGLPPYDPGVDWWADVGEAITDPIGTAGEVLEDIAEGVGGLVGGAAGALAEPFWEKAKPILIFGAAALGIVAVISLAR
jgi:hypothetical protein